MSVASFAFLLFVFAVIFLYYLFPLRHRWLVILAANIFFYCSHGIGYIIYMIISSLAAFYGALLLRDTTARYKEKIASSEKEQKKQLREELKKKKKTICTYVTLLVLGIWIVLKYTNFLVTNINGLFPGLSLPLASWLMPLGISFYTFDLLGYLIDVYREKYEAETEYLRLFTFVSFFPHIIQGPFSRYDELGKQLKEEHPFSYPRLTEGACRVLWGFFKKLVVADKLGIAIAAINASYQDYPAIYLVFSVIMYSFQLYADFSGYMDIMCGISHALGIELTENFKQPYLAKSVDEFWRRWHITLGEWFKDYVFYSLSMSGWAYKISGFSRKRWGNKAAKLIPGYIALIFVWTATGLWHGADWKHLLWAYLNMITIMYAMQFEDQNQKLKERLHIDPESLAWKTFCVLRTFLVISFFRIFTNVDTVMTGFSYIRHLFTGKLFVPVSLADLFVSLKTSEMIIILLGIVMMIVVDLLNESKRWESAKQNCPMLIRSGVLAVLIIVIILFAGGDNDLVGGFMYEYF